MNVRWPLCLSALCLLLMMPACRSREPQVREQKDNVLRDYIEKPIDAAKGADAAVQEHNRRMREAAGETP